MPVEYLGIGVLPVTAAQQAEIQPHVWCVRISTHEALPGDLTCSMRCLGKFRRGHVGCLGRELHGTFSYGRRFFSSAQNIFVVHMCDTGGLVVFLDGSAMDSYIRGCEASGFENTQKGGWSMQVRLARYGIMQCLVHLLSNALAPRAKRLIGLFWSLFLPSSDLLVQHEFTKVTLTLHSESVLCQYHQRCSYLLNVALFGGAT
jgi:hypothetical protein